MVSEISRVGGKKTHEAGADAPPELHAVKVELAIPRQRKVDLVVDDRIAAVLLSAREELEPDAPAYRVKEGV